MVCHVQPEEKREVGESSEESEVTSGTDGDEEWTMPLCKKDAAVDATVAVADSEGGDGESKEKTPNMCDSFEDEEAPVDPPKVDKKKFIRSLMDSSDGSKSSDRNERNSEAGTEESSEISDGAAFNEEDEDMERLPKGASGDEGEALDTSSDETADRCPVAGCAEKPSSPKELAHHMALHSTPLPCGRCKKTYSKASALRRHHSGSHLKLKPFPCGYCHKMFSRRDSLMRHELSHTGGALHLCGACGAQFNHRSSLKTHLLLHSGKKPHICPYCDEKFTQSSHLKVHWRTHLDTKPLPCYLCPRRCSTAGNMKSHMCVHTGRQPYKCAVADCGQSFTQLGSLKTHMAAIHRGEKPLSCAECAYKTAYSGDLYKHQKKKHPV